jgi:hypothetical protein
VRTESALGVTGSAQNTAQNGTSGVLADGKLARHWAALPPPRTGVGDTSLMAVRVLSESMPVPSRVLIAADLESSGIWSIGTQGHCAVRPSELLDEALTADLKTWNDSADLLFGGKAEADEDARASFRVTADQLADRVQDQLGDDWEVLVSVADPDWCFRWVRPPAAWRSHGR